MHTCETLPENINTVDKTCTTDFECASTSLECSAEKKCQIKTGLRYIVADSASGASISHCNDNQISLYSTSNIAYCTDIPSGTEKSDFTKYYFKKSESEYKVGIPQYKVAGKISFKTKQANTDFEVDFIDFADIGSLSVGTPIFDKRACETGFALYFYGDGTLTKPNGVTDPMMYLHCVNLKEVLSQNEVVYSLSDGEEKIYYTPGRINTDYIYSEELSFIKYEDEVKLEMFKNYREKLKGILEDCKNNYDYIEPYTCKNDELRKWWYFYNHPDEYMLYKDQEQVINYLVQKDYPEYQSVTENSGFLAIKYIFYLLILLSL